MIIKRTFWLNQIENLWKKRSIVWLAGVRRSGKTVICNSLDNAEFIDCENPRTRRLLQDPEGFLQDCPPGKRLAVDEIHRLDNASEFLKIAADYFPHIKILATGSSTLEANKRFRDTLAGRKFALHLTPMLLSDLTDFGTNNISRRLKHGGLPQFFLQEALDEQYSEWTAAYWARDVQELFRLERHHGFTKLMELLFINSGKIFEANTYTAPCELARPTVSNYLSVLEKSLVISIVRPFTSRRSSEIIRAPKVYGFDTGFICYYQGWTDLSAEQRGLLWEHLVLNELIGNLQTQQINYWRDKRGHEIDFVYAKRGQHPVAIECKWSHDKFDAASLISFRNRYPEGRNFVVARDISKSFTKTIANHAVRFVSLADLTQKEL